jgi:DNA modification methylase
MTLLHGDSLEKLKELPANSVDAVVTDPPYGLAFMGKKWDYDVPSTELWREVFRVMKPGAHLLSFGGTRTYHRMVVAIEDAGFEIRDQLCWLYGSGFPKSLDVSKAIDKAAGAEREVVGVGNVGPNMRGGNYKADDREVEQFKITAPATDSAKQWQGFGTALKPANEPIVLARKPLEKGLTVAQNVQKWGVGALNVDAGRIGSEQTTTLRNGNSGAHGRYGKDDRVFERVNPPGRWPANVLLDEEAAAALDEQSGTLKSGGKANASYSNENDGVFTPGGEQVSAFYGSSGGASRFFYVAKASKRERNAGLEGMPEKDVRRHGDRAPDIGRQPQKALSETNHHPTVKPIKLMEYLCKLITPPGGIILDPFMGSGTTGCAAVKLGYTFIGIERESDYIEIARRRIEHAARENEQGELGA